MKLHGNTKKVSLLLLTLVVWAVSAGAEPVPFADYGSGTTIELVSGKGTWQINWGQGPWTWSDNAGEPLFGSNVSSVLALHTTAPAQVSADLVATLPVHGVLTLSAHDKANANMVIGTMTVSGTGVNIIDINASRIVVDAGSGMCMGPFHPPGPELAMTLDEATGVFAYIKQAGDWRLELAGLYAMPLIEGMKLQDSILAALGGKVPLIGGLGTFALSGQYEAVASMRPQSFCEYGTGIALKLGAGQAVWDQIWGAEAPDWYECAAPMNAQFLGENVVSLLETADAGPATVDNDMIVRFTYGGKITINKLAAADSTEVIGQIIGEMDGLCIADLNAERATFDENGNIVILMGGKTLHSEPDVRISVVEHTGIFSDIHQAGTWCLYMTARVTIARDPAMPLQQNIMAGLGKPEFLIGADQEFVLTGWYYRQVP